MLRVNDLPGVIRTKADPENTSAACSLLKILETHRACRLTRKGVARCDSSLKKFKVRFRYTDILSPAWTKKMTLMHALFEKLRACEQDSRASNLGMVTTNRKQVFEICFTPRWSWLIVEHIMKD
jgi:hypothetical protein